MLKYLHIENIAVIENASIEFTGGFQVLTGETGAGKSIIIDAINAILGERTSRELIRAGCDTARVSAVFGDLKGEVLSALEQNGLSPDEDGNIVINRTLSNSGKGIIQVNERAVTAGILREIGKNLINIHGQHDSQNLLNPDNHCAFVDAVAENGDLIAEYYTEFKNLNAIRRELAALETDEEEKQRRTELLEYQIYELESTNIRIGEYEELKSKLTVAKNYEKTFKTLMEAYCCLNGDDNTDGAVTLIDRAVRMLNGLDLKDFSAMAGKLNEALEALYETCEEIRAFTEDGENANLDVDFISERLDFLHRLMLKYGNSEEKLLEFLTNAKKQLNDIVFSDKRAVELEEMLERSTEKLILLGEKVTASRKRAAADFEKKVCGVLQYLNMPGVKFAVKIEKGKYTRSGCDEVEFLISANAGEDLKPLHKIASGGELSRVMLAIKSVLSSKDSVDTLIFDEIDSGISGYAADRVAVQLQRVSQNRQVLCVTHLAQIAARAENHLLIEKSFKNGRTYTQVRRLLYEERISEIARIMSGTELTENLFNSAKELLDRSLANADL